MMAARVGSPPQCRYCSQPIKFVQLQDDRWVPVEIETRLTLVRDNTDANNRARFTTGYTVHNCDQQPKDFR